MYKTTYSGKYKKDYRLMKKRGYDMELLKEVVRKLEAGIPLDNANKNHPLEGEFIGSWECHIRFDWLLIYWKGEDYIELQRMGRHTDLY